LGYSFLFRNYRSDLGKWQTSDPLGYPDGWNNLAYCGNKVTISIDWLGCIDVIVVPHSDIPMDPALQSIVGYWEQEISSGRVDAGNTYIVHADDYEDARHQLERISAFEPITNLILDSGHGAPGKQNVGADPFLSQAIYDGNVNDFFENIVFSDNPTITFGGCNTGVDATPADRSPYNLAQLVSELTGGTVYASITETTAFWWPFIGYTRDFGEQIRYIDGIRE